MSGMDEKREEVRAEVRGALYAGIGALRWALFKVKERGEPTVAGELEQVLEWLYYLANALEGDEPVKPWSGHPIPCTSGPPIPLIQQWLGLEGLARVGEWLEAAKEKETS